MSTVVDATQDSRPGRLLRTLSDERLVSRVRNGDQAAFEVVYDRYHRQLLSFCRHMLGSREEAEDALQQTCINAFQAMRSDDRPIQLKAWLFAIARNRCLTVLRARKEHADISDHEPSVEGLAAEVQHRADLRELLGDLQRLPEDQRAALVLSELGAHSHEEIAVILDVRKDKIKALVFQAREQLSGARAAREVDCSEIREKLATLRGGALRRTQLRRHVETCPGCASFRADVQRQRAAMAVMLPVVPGVALKGSVLGAVFGSGSASGIGGGGGLLAGGTAAAAVGAAGTGSGGGIFAIIGAQGAAVKALAILAVAGGAGGGGYVAADGLSSGPDRPGAAATPATPAVRAVPAVAPATPAVPAEPPAVAIERRESAEGRASGKDRAQQRSGKGTSRSEKAQRASDRARSRTGAGPATRPQRPVTKTKPARTSTRPATASRPSATRRGRTPSAGVRVGAQRPRVKRTPSRISERRRTVVEESVTSGGRRSGPSAGSGVSSGE